MKTKTLKIAVIGISALAAISSMAQVGVQINVPVPTVTVQTPAVTVQAVPDSYVWDGTEYVGVIGSTYYYLGPGDVWITMDAPRLARFHDWEHGHPDWRTHAIRNEKYRRDAKGHEVPLRDEHAAPATHDLRDSHDTHTADHGQPNSGHDQH